MFEWALYSSGGFMLCWGYVYVWVCVLCGVLALVGVCMCLVCLLFGVLALGACSGNLTVCFVASNVAL